MPRRTALIVPVPEAEPVVGAIRLERDSSATRGVPAHITVLFPFAQPETIDEAALTSLFSRFAGFDFVLDRVERFEEGIVWLHPEPTAPFLDLTAAVWERWPEHPPYEGAHDTVIPHLTVSESPLEPELCLPIACRAREVLLIEEDESSGMWSTRARFQLA